MKATCSICGTVLRSRRSTKGSARANLLKRIRKHVWKEHRTTMIRRIKAGKKASLENPSVQDFMTALSEGPRSALAIYKQFTEKQYQLMKRTIDAFEAVLPAEVVITWKAIEAFHDMKKGS